MSEVRNLVCRITAHGAPPTVGCVGPKLLKDVQLTIFHNQYLRIVNGISNSVKREFAEDSVEICDIC